MKIGVLALASLAFATSATAATGENPFAKDQTVLEIKGLDLATADGQQRLAIRMDQAARTVCGEKMASVHLAAERKAQDCRAAVVADIRSQIETRRADASTAPAAKLALAD
ncbi:UrcA family protein [Novosphingobium sp. PhB57]|uniref:UrcA family protein n=1 Tax=unclassified Novosphingobium TaxID=2644732 RepID=UPI001051EBEA|nr:MULTISPECIES: UrcA family protein [unclassified Novosphingobium]TCU58914.1 UrcA family protein [Novosphingobium sp. PhB57]TDW61918.1 UrcA family protein [Novosphingobium sp. PhB55]